MNIIEAISDYINNDKLEEALELILKNEEVLSDNPELWNLKGVLCIKAGEYNTAVECLKKAINLDDKNADAYYNLAYIYENMAIYSDSAIYYGLAAKHTTNKALLEEIEDIYLGNDKLLEIKKCAKNSNRKTFIILSSCGFTEILQRMHHISKSLVKFGHEVIYISPRIDTTSDKKKFTMDIIINYIINNKKVVDGVQIYQPLNISYNDKLSHNSYTALVQYFIDNSQSEVVIVPYMPYQVDVIKELKGNFKVIYECVDDHTDLKYAFWGNKKDVVWEQELMDISHGITTTATSLYLQRTCIERRQNVYLSRNAVNEGDFITSEDEEIPEDLKNIPEPRIIYTGAIYDWFDEELFYSVVKSNPDKSFVIIGFGNDEILKEKCNNLYVLGTRKHSELKRYLRHSQLGIIPFKDDTDIIINCDPIKQYEYLACGLPVITTYMPESLINKVYTYNANNREDFNRFIEDALKVKIDKNIITEFLIENSWNERAALLCNIADEIVNEEKRKYVTKIIGEKLFDICDKYDFQIFKTLKAVYLNLEDSLKFEEYVEQAYNKSKHKYIEKQYLTALLKNNNIYKFINVVLDSPNISEEIKQELLYCQKKNKNELIKIILRLCINDIRSALMLLYNLPKNDFKILYKLYIGYLIGGEVNQKELNAISLKLNNSPLLKYLNKKINETKCKSVNIDLNKDPFISIIIPTRNSAEVLRYALMTCIEQNYDNYEIIVSDNSSPGNEETKNLVEELNCKRIKYYRTPREYAMIENYEFAYEKASGEYMIIMGSDDGLLLHCLEILPKMINKLNRPLSITWNPVAYGWPKVGINSIKNGLFIPYPSQKNNMKYSYHDETALKAVLNFETRYSILPMFYYNSIIKRELAEEAKRIAGKLFYASPPDIYTGIVFAYLQKKYIHVNMPMTIGGSSQKSLGITGADSIYKKNIRSEASEFEVKRLKEINLDYSEFNVPGFSGEEGAIVAAGTLAKKIFFKDSLDINRGNFYKACVKYLFADENFELKRTELYNCISLYGDKNLIEWYKNNYLNNKFLGYDNYQLNQLVVGYRENGGLVLDVSKFNVFDVFEAAKLYRNIVGY